MFKRKLAKILLWLALIPVIAAAGAVFFVRSGMLASLVLRTASARLDMSIVADEAEAGFDGLWTFRNISATMDGEDEPFFVASKLQIRTQPLRGILTSLAPEVRSVLLESPSLTLRRDEEGRLKVLSLAGGRKHGVGRAAPLRLPQVEINYGVVKYYASPDSVISLAPIHLNVGPSEGDAISFALKLPGRTSVTGEILPDNMRHNIDISIGDGASLLRGIASCPAGGFSLQASWSGRFDTDDPGTLDGDLTLRHLSLCDVTAAATASIAADSEKLTAKLTSLTIDPWRVLPRSMQRPGSIEARAGAIAWNYSGKSLAIDGLEFSLLEGSVVGSASLDLAHLRDTRLNLQYSRISLGSLIAEPSWQQTSLSGAIVVGPATEERPPEPLLVTFTADMQGPFAADAQLGAITATGYVGPRRFVSGDANVPVFGGSFSPWLSMTRRDDEIYIRVITDFNDIDLDRLVHFFRPDCKNVPGRLSGTARWSMFGKMRNISGNAEIRIADSDMVNVPVIAAVYNSLNLFMPSLEAKGTGRAVLAAHGDILHIRSFEYFNRGVEVRGAGAVTGLSAGQDAAVTGIVTGSLQPLRGTKLPGSKELDKLIESLQVGFVYVKVGGTLGEVSTKVVPLPEVKSSVEKLLWQQLR